MKLPVIKSICEFIDQNDEDYVLEAMDVLEHVSQANGLKDEEIEAIGELLSNMSGAIEVSKEVRKGTPQKEALNGFMQRVLGSIDR